MKCSITVSLKKGQKESCQYLSLFLINYDIFSTPIILLSTVILIGESIVQ